MTTIEDWRRFYAEEIRLAGNVRSRAVVEAFARVPREKFLGPPPWQILVANLRVLSPDGMDFDHTYSPTSDPQDLYHNILIGLDVPRKLNNGQPSALAYWIDALELKSGERVYHLGCGVGYYTAIMAEVVGSNGSVIGSEVNAELGARARINLAKYPNVKVGISDPDGAPYDPGDCDAMFINAGMTHVFPMWLDRLRESGRMVVPITTTMPSGSGQGAMLRIVRSGEQFSAETIGPVGIFSAIGLRDPRLEETIQVVFKAHKLSRVKSLRRDSHEPTETCIVHGASTCLSNAT